MRQSFFSRRLRGNVLLLITAIIWGVAFVAQKSGGSAMGPLTFNGVRSFIGAGGLFCAIQLLDRLGISRKPANRQERKTLWIGGGVCGVAMFLATNLQQFGLQFPEVTTGKAGFITALYIILVPLLGLLFGNRLGWLNWLGVALAVGGLYLLCGGVGGGFGLPDVLLLLCALMFSLQIMAVSHFSPLADGVRLSCIQFLVVGILNLPLMFLFEQPRLSAITANAVTVLYAGLLSSGVAYTLQILAQKDTEPTTASLLMSLESVFAALAGYVLLHDRLSAAELAGCGLMFAAVVLAQLPSPGARKGESHA